MSRRCGSWIIRCNECGEIYKLTNFMHRTYIEAGTGRKLHANLHKLKHLKESGKVAEVLNASS